MAVIHRTILHARVVGLSGDVDSSHLADMMDAIHNIPNCINEWDRWDVDSLRNDLIHIYDNKWSKISNFSMREVFDRALSEKSR